MKLPPIRILHLSGVTPMVEIFLPACPVSPSLGVRVKTHSDARALFHAFANDQDEVAMVVLGPFEDLHAMVVFGDVPLAEISRDPGPLVTLARNLGAESVSIAHLVDGMVVDGSAELVAQRTVGLALEVDDIHLAHWHTLGSASIATNVNFRSDGSFASPGRDGEPCSG